MEDLWTAFFRPSTKRARRIADKTYLESWSKDPDSEATSEETTEARLARARRALREALRKRRGIDSVVPFPMLLIRQFRSRREQLRSQVSYVAQSYAGASEAVGSALAMTAVVGIVTAQSLLSAGMPATSLDRRLPHPIAAARIGAQNQPTALAFPFTESQPVEGQRSRYAVQAALPSFAPGAAPPPGAETSTEVERGIGISITRTTSAWAGDSVSVTEEEPIWIYCDPQNPVKEAACDAYDAAATS